MKTTVFKLASPSYEQIDPHFDIYDESFSVPTLPAYAVLNHHIDCDRTYMGDYMGNNGYEIVGDKVTVKGVRGGFPGEITTAVLTIQFSGIRDYTLLFPQVENDSLRTRLGQFAEEAEKAFEVGAWMSFTIMATSVLEGVLFDIYDKYHFHELISAANADDVITEDEAGLLDNAREIRNRVHASKYQQPFSDRKISNDLYVLYDKLIKKNWGKND